VCQLNAGRLLVGTRGGNSLSLVLTNVVCKSKVVDVRK
jgi:hypothetical protein